MTINNRIEAFSTLGQLLQTYKKELIKNNKNPWFTAKNIDFAVDALSYLLKYEKLEQWISKYPLMNEYQILKRVGVIMAGNIPLVGFHDFLSVLITGHIFIGKLSSKDDRLLPAIIKLLVSYFPEFGERIFVTESQLNEIDAVIAAGSNNSSRYFNYYFEKYPHIIRKNRNSVAVLTGNESDAQLSGLVDDIFMYFGLGCRNVSKLFLPMNYDLDIIFNASLKYKDIATHHKYANNYDYNRVIYLMNKVNFKENGFMILKEDINLASPISVVYYEYYTDITTLSQRLRFENENIQCIVSNDALFEKSVHFGKSQEPELYEYADNIDTINFLLNL
jgi:hypothetical protein